MPNIKRKQQRIVDSNAVTGVRQEDNEGEEDVGSEDGLPRAQCPRRVRGFLKPVVGWQGPRHSAIVGIGRPDTTSPLEVPLYLLCWALTASEAAALIRCCYSLRSSHLQAPQPCPRTSTTRDSFILCDQRISFLVRLLDGAVSHSLL